MSGLNFPNLTPAENERLWVLQGQVEVARTSAIRAVVRGDSAAARAAFVLERSILDEQVSIVLHRRLSLG